ncbi:B3 domain-containing protein Os02g0598200-like isoform X2 [Telopea speciosissima]|uniref:B3 domain-containing protein Os02g0598200-like isoform X2 n=1 Tax=Telopea speciosissima TaxID=54955 RepID=UPI001CC355F6|nr:B3 domain-containing protein Os02g0598200-like isoform X2 [Telopea speciosissima]
MEGISLVGSSGSVPQNMTKMSGCFGAPVVLEGEKGKKSKMIKEEFEEKVNLSSKENKKAYKSVKIEPMDSDDLSAPNLISFCYSVTAVTESWLELPTVSVSRDVKSKKERKIVLLRDPARRVWPVLYQERSGFRGLTSGWEAFAKANNIQPGDVCMFGVESQSEGLLRVTIVRKYCSL